MTREQALAEADKLLLSMIRSGDPAIMESARGPDGRVDQTKIARAAMSARERLADQILAESTPPNNA